jgi:hypothetical protein
VCLQQQVFALGGDFVGAREGVFGGLEVTALAGDDPLHAIGLAIGVRVVQRRGTGDSPMTDLVGPVEVAALDPHLGDVDLDHGCVTRGTQRRRHVQRSGKRFLGFLPLLPIAVQPPEVVLDYRCRVAPQARCLPGSPCSAGAPAHARRAPWR